MQKEELIAECLKGGPGLNGYIFNGDTYCEDCAAKLLEAMAERTAWQIEDTEDPLFSDSETIPQPIFFGESDSPQYCCKCNDYLYGK